MSLTIKGEAGKALDDTARDFATMRIRSASLRLATLEDDVLEWTASTADVTAGTAPIPEVGQIVELYDGATRRFRGHALDPVYTLYGVQIRVVGPWWWMRGENATSTQTDSTGATGERPIVRFETGNLSTHFGNAIIAMIAAGIPIQSGGTIATTFNIPTVSYQVSSWGDVIARLMEWIADGVAWFDYSGTGHPKLNISRRGSMSTNTVTIGTTLLDGGSFRLSPMTELKAEGVSIPYLDRSPTTGKPTFEVQDAGSGGTRTTKIVPVSGPELLDFLPFDDFDSWEYTSATSFTAQNAWAIDPQFAKAKELTNYPFVATHTHKNAVQFPTQIWTYTTSIEIRNDDGNLASFPRYITSATPPPEWAIKQLGLVKVNAVGFAFTYYISYTNSYNQGSGNNTKYYNPPAWLEPLGAIFVRSGFTNNSYARTGAQGIVTSSFSEESSVYRSDINLQIYGAPSTIPTANTIETTTGTYVTSTSVSIAVKSYDDAQYIGRQMTIQVVIFTGWPAVNATVTITAINGNVLTFTGGSVNLALNTTTNVTITRNTLVYKDLDYGFLNPPAGLATNLLNAQNWTPWEGGVTLKNKTCPNPQLLGTKWNVANLGAGPASAGALLRSVDLDLASYDLTLRWGPPSRLNYQSLVRQASARPQDTIIEV